MTAAVAVTNASAQKLQVLALQVYNDAVKLLGNISTTQVTINAGTASVGDFVEMGQYIADLTTQLQFIDNEILKLQQQTSG
jgi:hypothetical protein